MSLSTDVKALNTFAARLTRERQIETINELWDTAGPDGPTLDDLMRVLHKRQQEFDAGRPHVEVVL